MSRGAHDRSLRVALWAIGGSYVAIIGAMLLAHLAYAFPGGFFARLFALDLGGAMHASVLSRIAEDLAKPALRQSVVLALVTSTVSAILSLWVAVPLGYLMARGRFRGKAVIDILLDVPIVLPPLVVGLSLLILFQFRPFTWGADWFVYEPLGVVLAQFVVAASFAVRAVRSSFELIDPRHEQVAQTLGASPAQAFFRVVLPQARGGMITGFTLAWARSIGEFGPVLVFAGTTRGKTEVLSTSVYLELTAGDLHGMVAVSILMLFCAMVVLVLTRALASTDPLRP